MFASSGVKYKEPEGFTVAGIFYFGASCKLKKLSPSSRSVIVGELVMVARLREILRLGLSNRPKGT
jgi:hypothetical protein